MSVKAQFAPHVGKQTEFLSNTCDDVFFGGSRGPGKAQPLDAQVLTPFGFKEMRDIKIGSMVCNPDGSVANVIQIHPQGIKQVFLVTMADGGNCEVTADHLWLATISCKQTKRNGIKDNHYCVYTTDSLSKFLSKEYAENHYPHIPFTQPVKFTVSGRNKLLDPYYIGLVLGDGHISPNHIGITTNDPETINWLSDFYNSMGFKFSIYKKQNTDAVNVICHEKQLRALLSSNGVGRDKSLYKSIPYRCAFGSIETRYAILQGLMDTDGTVDKEGCCSFTSISKDLADGVLFLLRSLGYAGTVRQKKAGYKKNGVYIQCNDAYEVYITGNNKENLFRLPRKKSRCVPYNGGSHEQKRRIVSIEYVRDAECQCITVNNPNGLYITNDFIVTHNSFSLAYDAAFKYRVTTETGRVKVSIDYPDYTALILRRKFVDIQMNFKPICDALFVPAGGKWKERDRCYNFPSGAKIILGHCDTYNDVEKYIGGNFQYLGIEEANQFPYFWFEQIRMSVRSTNPEIKAHTRLTSNPGGIGHLWLKKRYYDMSTPVEAGSLYNKRYDLTYPDIRTGDVYTDEFGGTRQFIPALVMDNPSILENDPSYVNNLKSITDPVLRDMWLYGKWDVQVGSFFECWNAFHHVIDGDEWKEHFKENRHLYRIYRAIDYGTSKPFVCLWLAVDKDGNVVVFDEIHRGNLSVSHQARLIKEKNALWDLDESDIFLTVVDPAMRSKTAEYEETPVSPIRIYEINGLRNFMYGNNKRIPGWAVVRDYLQIPDNGVVKLRFTDYCTACITTIPELVRDKTNIEDIDTLGDDHCADALRYCLMQLYNAYLFTSKPKDEGWRSKVKEKQEEHKKPSLWV